MFGNGTIAYLMIYLSFSLRALSLYLFDV